MNDLDRREIKINSYDFNDYFEVIFLITLLSPIAFLFICNGSQLLFTQEFNWIYIVGLLVGLTIAFSVYLLIISCSKTITFHDDYVVLQFLTRKVRVSYSEIEWIKFIQPINGRRKSIFVKLKKRTNGSKSIPINLKNNLIEILTVLNFSRKKGIILPKSWTTFYQS
jgi:hypothetical protein